ncbi:short-chain dehydrogenase [Streptomyces dioscori]|uniref:Short-chain dehydrogenase n=1 Tax=Streptomyces dioscori TaxID=2109333 RepID=A0A2P8PY82_9ACTN|nr:SDR family NAD(P)-dependent oxidoreductase [Streptomyces dioscori]PSM38957.1 short-chain dehydrogenase [Streptomyces dioscori]
MAIILVTGATRGIGYETVRTLADAGHAVWLGARDPERGKKAAQETGAHFVHLDVTDDSSIEAATHTVGELDVLINNAGILEPNPALAEATRHCLQVVFDTNVFGPVRVTNAFLPALSRSDSATVINVTSSIGSLSKSADVNDEFTAYPQDLYRASKAALNMFTVQCAKANPTMRVNCVDPGLTGTEMMGGFGQPPAVAAATIARAALLGPEGPTGQFLGPNGVVPW